MNKEDLIQRAITIFIDILYDDFGKDMHQDITVSRAVEILEATLQELLDNNDIV